MEKEDMKLQCVRLAIEVMGPHPSTTYVQANKQKFAADVREEAKAIFEWVSGKLEDPKIVEKVTVEPVSGKIPESVTGIPMGKGPHGKP